ncbi:exo-beta-N-acetylmuramidase NamZ domain-containing protein [Reichenbachiella sp. MSK19-1]|uniref:exo-beta-N-acetylmuramidase NamZ family protein n=1 Tax=Reichenbachiella sp. MSK19-1 TaxID=1897631 RepID=UPI000E6CCCC1|nr:DUF1343 domain-containing protein [Reichenbachiella sp. MSK19-1]RJE72955.1 hypothetical protein BGP76_03135 [Reichenbachiella sp. MSK19-1]
MVKTGLDILSSNKTAQQDIKGNIGYLCHAASIDTNIQHGIDVLQSIFGERLSKLFSPQHGLSADVQDNMVESDHFEHSHYHLPVYSLYSETRKPTPSMLDNLDHVIIDLQDVGTRIYTYIYTMIYMMEACGELGIPVTVLDRPNPIDTVHVEGNVLDMQYRSFIGRYPMPMRHGLTIGEVAQMATTHWDVKCELNVIKMTGYDRQMSFFDTGLPWVLPSPNLPTVDGAYVFPGSVLFEGTNISEGRGTSRGLEIIGHPDIKHFDLLKTLTSMFREAKLEGFVLRPVTFIPTFQKHHGIPCQGYQVHVTDLQTFEPWKVGQILCKAFYHHLGQAFQWKQPPYEYEYNLLPIDILNGTDQVRQWIESNGSLSKLEELDMIGRGDYLKQRDQILIY